MIERHANGKSGRPGKVPAALAAIMLTVLPVLYPAKVLAAEAQSYTISIETLQEQEPEEQQNTEPEELPEYGAVKTADKNNSTAIWVAVLLLGTGWILDKTYLSDKWEDKHD